VTGEDVARAAEALVGTPFRLHGRDPRTGVDCVGLLECVFRSVGYDVRFPNGYSLRTSAWEGLEAFAQAVGFAPVRSPAEPGDICLLRPCETQMHFAIVARAPCTQIEAHAGLRRVVAAPLASPHLQLRRWRMT
jgi:cell wall-associated NlpC family hydrolase